MALRQPVRTTDDIRALVPGDDAIDMTAPASIAYFRGEDMDPNQVIFRGPAPVWWTLRPMDAYARRLIVAASEDNAGALDYWTVRACFKSVEGLSWWTPKWEAWNGMRILTLDSVRELAEETWIQFLSAVVWHQSVLDAAKKKHSTSSPGEATGPTTGPGPVSTTARSPATQMPG